MKKTNSLLAIVLLTLFIFTGIFTGHVTKAEAADYCLSSSYKMMYVGQTYQNTVKNTSSSVKWTSANSNIASVSSGLVTAKNIGITYIYAEVAGTKLTMKVEVVSSTAYKATTYANSKVGCKYSQSKRMSTGYYDCGSLVWRAYQYAGYTWGSSSTNAPTAADGAKALNSLGKTISYSGLSSSKLLAGDLVYSSTRSNGRYRNITHAAFYAGNGRLVEAANTRKGVCRSTYKTTNVVLIARPSVTVSNGLQEPQLVSAEKTSTTVGSSSVKVTWNQTRNATGYIVYRKIEGGSWSKLATITSSSTTSYTDTKAYAGTYYYTVRAYKNSTSTLSTYNKKGVSASTTLAKPESVTAESTDNGVKLTWSKVTAANSYEIRRKASGDSSYKTIATISSGSTVSYTDKTAQNGKNYTYAVRAVRKNSTDSIVYSKFTFASEITFKLTVAQPADVTACNTSNGVKLAWSGVSNATGYEIRRKTNSDSEYKTIAVISGTSTLTYVDQKSESGMKYMYAVRAVRTISSSSSAYSKFTFIASYFTCKLPQEETTAAIKATEKETTAAVETTKAAETTVIETSVLETTASETGKETAAETTTVTESSEESSEEETTVSETESEEVSVQAETEPETEETSATEE